MLGVIVGGHDHRVAIRHLVIVDVYVAASSWLQSIDFEVRIQDENLIPIVDERDLQTQVRTSPIRVIRQLSRQPIT